MSTHPRFITAVVGIIVNDVGQFLLTQRYMPAYPAVHENWQMPGGGIEFGESPEETLHRELKEELGIEVEILFPHPLVKSNCWPAHPESGRPATQVMVIAYLVKITGGQLQNQLDEETMAYKWYPLEEVEKLATLPNTVETLRAAQELLPLLT